MLTRSIALLSLLTIGLTATNSYSGQKTPSEVRPDIVTDIPSESHGKGAFTRNMGQWDENVLFQTAGGGATIWICRDRILYQFSRPIANSNQHDVSELPTPWAKELNPPQHDMEHVVVTARFVEALPSATASGIGQSTHPTNYFIGNDATKWRTNVPSYNGAMLSNVYEGVDFSFRTENGNLSYEAIAQSTEAMSRIQIEYEGVDAVRFDTDRTATVSTGFGEFSFDGLTLVTPESTSKTARMSASASANASVAYSTYLGGTMDDLANDVTVDADGNAYIVGMTNSVDFPSENQFQTPGGNYDIFVTKLNAAGNDIVFSTYIGGGSSEYGYCIAIDQLGNSYIAGSTYSSDFPTVNPFDPSIYDVYNSDGCVLKLNNDGSQLIYSTYLGGSHYDACSDIAVDDAGNCYVVGSTFSANFPFPSPFHASIPVAVGDYDGFVTKFNATGDGVYFSLYLGGTGEDIASGIDMDGNGNVWITGYTRSQNFPTVNALQGYINSPAGEILGDAFVTEINATGSAFLYSTYFGGLGDDGGSRIVVDASGVYFAGNTSSTDFPTLNPVQTDQPLSDVFVTKLTGDGSAVTYSTYLGGLSSDGLYGFDVGASGDAYVTGNTYSSNMPIRIPFQSNHAYPSYRDGFFTRINASGDQILYGSFLGGHETDYGSAIAVDANGVVTVVGNTQSTLDFPLVNAIQTTAGLPGLRDGFVTKLSTNYEGCCAGTRGNANGDASDLVNVVDLTFIVQFLFAGGVSPSCMEEADVNGNGPTNVVDLTTLVSFLFVGGSSPATCF